jgi:hypothetical protein
MDVRIRIQKKISLITEITCWDYCKSRDGIYEITYHYDAWSGKGCWYVNHPGYIFEIEPKQEFKSFEDAEKYLEEELDKEWKSQVNWFEMAIKNPSEWDVFWENAPKDIEAWKEEWAKL